MFTLDMAANAVERTDVGALTRNEVRQIVRCKDVSFTSIDQGIYPGQEIDSVSADNVLNPFTSDLKKILGVKSGDSVKVSIVEAPQHGKLYPIHGFPTWSGYLAEREYKGHDRVVFLAEANGKQLRIVLNLLVGIVDDDDSHRCRFEKFESVGSNSTEAVGQRALKNTTQVTIPVSAGSIILAHLAFANFSDSALAKTIGTSSSAQQPHPLLDDRHK